MNLYFAYTVLFLVVQEQVDAGFTISGMNINGNYNSNKNVNQPFYQTNTKEFRRKGKCMRKLTVTGNGVDDSFEEPCSNKSPSTIMDSNYLIVGDPDKTQLCLFTDAFAKLVVIGKKQCHFRTYTTKNGETTKIESLMDETICTEVKRKVSTELVKNRIYWQSRNRKTDERMRKASPPGFPFHKNNDNSDDSSSSSSSSSEEDTNKTPYTNILNGVTHGSKPPTLSSPIKINLMPQPLSPTHDVNVSPPYRAAKPSTLVTSIIPNNQNTDNIKPLSNSIFTLETSFPGMNKKGQCQVKFSVDGNGVRDSFLEPCSHKDLELISRDSILMLGNPMKNIFCLYSKEPSILVVIKSKICTKRIYSMVNGKITSKKVPLTISKCTEIKRTMVNEMQRSKDKKPVKTNPQELSSDQQPTQAAPATVLPAVDDQINKPSYGMQSTWNYDDNGCFRDIEVLGKGIHDHLVTPCPATDRSQLITTDNILLLIDPLGDLELFSDTWATLVVIQNGQCTKRNYNITNGQIEITPTSMSGDECTGVKEKMAAYM